MSVLDTVFIALFIVAGSVFVAFALWLNFDWVDDEDAE